MGALDGVDIQSQSVRAWQSTVSNKDTVSTTDVDNLIKGVMQDGVLSPDEAKDIQRILQNFKHESMGMGKGQNSPEMFKSTEALRGWINQNWTDMYHGAKYPELKNIFHQIPVKLANNLESIIFQNQYITDSNKEPNRYYAAVKDSSKEVGQLLQESTLMVANSPYKSTLGPILAKEQAIYNTQSQVLNSRNVIDYGK